MIDSRYRRFIPERAAIAQLDAQTQQIAALFDGRRDAAQRIAAARELSAGWDAGGLEALALHLAQSGCLQAGHLEPLPVPDYAQYLNLNQDDGGSSVHVPSSVPGSLSTPGLLGALAGLGGERKGQAGRLAVECGPFWRWLLERFGGLLIWPLRSRAAFWLYAALLVTAGFALFSHRLEVARNLFDLLGGGGHSLLGSLLGAIAAVALINLCAAAARVAAIARETGELPRSGLVFGFLNIPRLSVETGGAPERAARMARLRIVAASLVGIGALAFYAVLLWFFAGPEHPSVRAAAVLVCGLSLAAAVLMINPITRHDGYFLLAHWLRVPDLREQGMLALFGWQRPWFTQQRRLPPRALQTYAVLVVLYLVFVLTMIFSFFGRFIAEHFHGTGFLLLISVMGMYMYKQFKKANPGRNNLGWTRNWMPGRRTWWILGALIVVSLIPYRFEPSGAFEVMPQKRADLRATVPGNVVEVPVQEGMQVAAGDVIVRLNDSEQQAKLIAAQAQVAKLRSDLALANKGGKPEEVELARQAVATAKKREEVARGNAARLAQAFRRGAVTAQEYERARGVADVATQELGEAQRSLALVRSPAAVDRIESIKAQIAEAEAALTYAKQQLEVMRITAPVAGTVISDRLLFALGNYLERGELLGYIEDTTHRLGEIQLPESAVGEVEVGRPVSAKLWAFPGTSFDGVVRAIAPAAEEGPYGMIVRVQVELQDPEGQLKSGMTGNAKVQGHWHPLIVVFTRAIMRFLLVEVWSWIP